MFFGMIKKYDDLLKLIREYQYEKVIGGFFKGLPSIFDEFYPNAKDEVRAVYLKNFFNDNKKEVIFFFINKIVVVTKSDDNLSFNFVDYRGKVKKKEFFIHREQETHRHTSLKLFLDTGDSVTLDNELDTNKEWATEYGNEIKEISKMF